MASRTVKRWFYVFLDRSGILLGIFLTRLGSWIAASRPLPAAVGLVVLLTGLAALFVPRGTLTQVEDCHESTWGPTTF